MKVRFEFWSPEDNLNVINFVNVFQANHQNYLQGELPLATKTCGYIEAFLYFALWNDCTAHERGDTATGFTRNGEMTAFPRHKYFTEFSVFFHLSVNVVYVDNCQLYLQTPDPTCCVYTLYWVISDLTTISQRAAMC